MDQVAKDNQLLDIAQDFFHFVTKFFEPINVSATHIYHSALELCPTSSIVRKLYYDRCHGSTRFPRVAIGNLDPWDETISPSRGDCYESCTWSPCGRFIAAQMEEVIEIRNQLTFQLSSLLRLPENASLLQSPLAYSPDGQSLACTSFEGIIIWDIQTGGVVQSIDCPGNVHELVWSLDGGTIAITLAYSKRVSSVITYDAGSGAQLFEETVEKEQILTLWAHEKSFRFLSRQVFSNPETSDPDTSDSDTSDSDTPISDTSVSDTSVSDAPGTDASDSNASDSNASDSDASNSDTPDFEINMSIFEIGPTFIKIEPLPGVHSPTTRITFSPSTHRISLSGHGLLRIIDVRNSHKLFEDRGKFFSPQFSSDGNLFAALQENVLHVWKYTSGSYVLLREFPLSWFSVYHTPNISLEFSPASTSILYLYGDVFQVQSLHRPSIAPQTRCQHAAISHSGRYIATADESQSTITIIDLHSQAPSQFIDTGGEIEGLAITGNVLLVAFSETVVGWLLTKEGRVEGLVESRRAGHSDSIWTITSLPWHPKSLCFRVSGQVGLIGTDNILPFSYHTGTGGVPDNFHQPQYFGFPWVSIYKPGNYREYHYLRHHDAPQRDTPPEDGWLTFGTTTGKAGWVVDPEGRHRFWVPVEWRRYLSRKNWHHDITTLFVRIKDEPVVIKF